MEAWKHGSMEAWKHGSMEAWKHGSMEAWKWKHGSMGSRKHISKDAWMHECTEAQMHITKAQEPESTKAEAQEHGRTGAWGTWITGAHEAREHGSIDMEAPKQGSKKELN
jgi:hypothetical protein